MKFKVGDRVKRTSAGDPPGVLIGVVGVVIERPVNSDAEGRTWVRFEGYAHVCWYSEDHVAEGRIVTADAPAVGAPGDAFRAAVREELDLATRQMDERNQRAPVYANNQASFQQQDRSQMLGLGGWEPADVTKLKAEYEQLRGERVHWTKELDAYAAHVDKLNAENVRIAETLAQQNKQIGSLEAALKEATGSKLRVGDLHGTVAALRADVARLEGDVAFWKREAVRRSGSKR